MYKFGKWLYDLGTANARKQLELDMLYFLGGEPVRYSGDDGEWLESEKHYAKRIDEWFAQKQFVGNFFAQADNDDVL